MRMYEARKKERTSRRVVEINLIVHTSMSDNTSLIGYISSSEPMPQETMDFAHPYSSDPTPSSREIPKTLYSEDSAFPLGRSGLRCTDVRMCKVRSRSRIQKAYLLTL